MAKHSRVIAGIAVTASLCAALPNPGTTAPLPSPVKTCEDLRAYISPDSTMTMETWRALLTATGFTVDDQSLNDQCMIAARATGSVTMIQPILRKADGGVISLSSRLVSAGPSCKLTHITLDGC